MSKALTVNTCELSWGIFDLLNSQLGVQQKIPALELLCYKDTGITNLCLRVLDTPCLGRIMFRFLIALLSSQLG